MADKVDQATQSMIENLEKKTGRSLAEWVKLAQGSGHARHKDLMGLLKGEHGLTHGYANLVALKTLEAGAPPAAGEDLVAAQFAGDKAAVKPIYDAVLKAVKKFGRDVEVSPKKAYVSLRRGKQFGLVQPSTRTRVDVGLVLKGVKPQGRLEASGSFNAMCTHRVRVGSVTEVDGELVGWLKRAYEGA